MVCIGVIFVTSICVAVISAHQNQSSMKILTEYSQVPSAIDAIFVLGGGVPSSLYEPPIYVQQRCDDAAAIRQKLGQDTPILTLSAGTAHLPQALTKLGLPIWESTASAAYLQKKHNLEKNMYVETTSYDTIGNAFFARASHTDIVGWQNLLIITNEVRRKRWADWHTRLLPS